MKMLWVIFIVGVTLADKLDRGYLPPPGAVLSGGNLDATNVPLPLPKYSTSDKDIIRRPEIAIGIDRVAPNQVTETFEERIPDTENNDNSFIGLTKTGFQDFTKSTPSMEVVHYTAKPDHYFTSKNPSQIIDNEGIIGSSTTLPITHQTDNRHQFQNVDIHPSDSTFNDQNDADLAYGEDIDSVNIDHSNTSPTVNNGISNFDSYDMFSDSQDILKYPSSINQQSSITLNYPNRLNSNLPATGDQFFMLSSSASITDEGSSKINHITNVGRPERIQSQSDRNAVILNYEQSRTPAGYAYSYDTSNGIHADESGITVNGVRAKGSYSYIGDDGKLYHVEYTADENGFIPKGAHLPTSPPIPDAILNVIQQAAKDKEAGIYDDGSYNEEKYGYKKYQGGLRNKQNYNGVSLPRGYNDNSNILRRLNKQYETGIANENHNIPEENIMLIQNSNAQSLVNNNDNPNSYTEGQQRLDNAMINKPSVLNENDFKEHQALGYQYFPPQSMFAESQITTTFPPRFSSIETNLMEKHGEINNGVTAKPFLTPYVSRKSNDSGSYEPGKRLFENQNQKNYDDSTTYPDYLQDDNEVVDHSTRTNSGHMPSRKFIPGKVPEQPQYESGIPNIDNDIPSGEKKEAYKNENIFNKFKQQSSMQPFITTDTSVHYSTSETLPTEFPSRFTSPDQGVESYSPGRIQTSPNLSFSTSTQTQITGPRFLVNQSNYPYRYDQSNLVLTSTSTLRPDSILGDVRFGPSTQSKAYSDSYKGSTTTENTITEDFSGPKRQQSFDPDTGYYY